MDIFNRKPETRIIIKEEWKGVKVTLRNKDVIEFKNADDFSIIEDSVYIYREITEIGFVKYEDMSVIEIIGEVK